MALNLTEMCGNYSNTGYCIDSNSACLPSAEDGADWRCRCTYGYFTHNSSCVPGIFIKCFLAKEEYVGDHFDFLFIIFLLHVMFLVPSSLFEKMDMVLGSSLKTDRFVSLLQEASNNSGSSFKI